MSKVQTYKHRNRTKGAEIVIKVSFFELKKDLSLLTIKGNYILQTKLNRSSPSIQLFNFL